MAPLLGGYVAVILYFSEPPQVQFAAPQIPAYVPGPVWIMVPGLGPVRASELDALLGDLDV
jgi:hypothetical protein